MLIVKKESNIRKLIPQLLKLGMLEEELKRGEMIPI